MEDWDEGEEDQVLYESEEYTERYNFEPEKDGPIPADDLPVLPLRGVVVYPMMWLPLPIGQRRSIRLVEDNLPENRIIALVTSKDEEVEKPGARRNSRDRRRRPRCIACCAPRTAPSACWCRAWSASASSNTSRSSPICVPVSRSSPNNGRTTLRLEAIMRAVQELFRRLIDLEPQMPDELAVMAMNVENAAPTRLSGRQQYARSMPSKRQDILEMDSVYDKLLAADATAPQRGRSAGAGPQDSVRSPRRDGADAARLLPARADEGDPKRAGRGGRTGCRHPRTGRAHRRRRNVAKKRRKKRAANWTGCAACRSRRPNTASSRPIST